MNLDTCFFQTNLDVRGFISKKRVVLLYGKRNHKLESRLDRHNYAVFCNNPEYKLLLDPGLSANTEKLTGTILIGLDGQVKAVTCDCLNYHQIKDFPWNDRIPKLV